MSFNWLDYLDLSKKLQSDPKVLGLPEASLRSATSRAYYAAFHYAMNLAKKEGYPPTYSGGDHFALPKFFQNYRPVNQIRRKIAVDLDRLRGHRNLSDYEEKLGQDANILAQLAIGMANSIISKVDSLAPK